MMLDLFITHWNEPWDVGEKGFRMLRDQRGVDWSKIRVTLVHDGSDAFPEEYFAGYPFNVNQVCLPHGGIAKARNWCIDHSEAEWIKWCDFDDMFASIVAMNDIMHVLPNDNQMLWFELLWDYHGKIFLRKDRDPIFVHNKLFRREFLINRGIRFNEDLIWCEDSAFLAVVEMEIDHQRIGKIIPTAPIYMYIVREGSLCNRPEIRYQNLQSFFMRHTYVADEFLKRGMMDQYYTMCLRVMCDSYYVLHKAKDTPEDKSEHGTRVWAWYDKHADAVKQCRAEMVPWVMNAVNKEIQDAVITWDEVRNWMLNHERNEEKCRGQELKQAI